MLLGTFLKEKILPKDIFHTHFTKNISSPQQKDTKSLIIQNKIFSNQELKSIKEKKNKIKDFEFLKFQPRVHSPMKIENSSQESEVNNIRVRSQTPSACFLRTERKPNLFKSYFATPGLGYYNPSKGDNLTHKKSVREIKILSRPKRKEKIIEKNSLDLVDLNSIYHNFNQTTRGNYDFNRQLPRNIKEDAKFKLKKEIEKRKVRSVKEQLRNVEQLERDFKFETYLQKKYATKIGVPLNTLKVKTQNMPFSNDKLKDAVGKLFKQYHFKHSQSQSMKKKK